MVVERVEALQMQDRARGLALGAEADGAFADAVVPGDRPAVGAGHHLHAVGAQRVEFARGAVDGDAFDPGVAGDEEVAVDLLQQPGADLVRVGAGEKREERMARQLAVVLEEDPRHRGGGLADHAHGAMDDRVAGVALTGERGVVARRPHRSTERLHRDERAGRRGAGLGRGDGRDRGIGNGRGPVPEAGEIGHGGSCRAAVRDAGGRAVRANRRGQSPRTFGLPRPSSIRAVRAQTRASRRSGERPEERPSGPKSQSSSSSSGKVPTWRTRPWA